MEPELSNWNLSQQGKRETCTGTAATGGKWLKLEPGTLVPPELQQTAPSSSLLLTPLLAAPQPLSVSASPLASGESLPGHLPLLW